MVYSWRRKTELYNTRVYHGDFRQYWQPYYQLNRQPVFATHVRPVPEDHIQTSNMDNQKWAGKSKSKATKARDKLRRQTFIERKTRCSGFPFFGLEDDEFRHEMVNKVDWQDVKFVRTLRSAEKTMRTSKRESNFEINQYVTPSSFEDETEKNKELNLTLQKQNEEQIRLQQDLDFEKKRAIKFVSQNVEREREIRILRKDLNNQIEFCNRLAEHPNHLIDRVVYLETEKQNLENFIDSLPRKWKDRLR